ncbi:uncharacterized protein UMAG_02626 [Mycosarcoma maydis]|uniref:L-ornithine N(5)-monooxygenase n=1 Tax=Mycosarcoma maydis TaxID=5270 RepID=A0A0D1CRR6_MYCMD|nr:uncharacterized protein UMAG_02626 [Ustilago maydis 521]KIS69283.1 hypothetical protein UMAG_02626 [Ustilago maydis 521]|eukprot:XP_011389023.1 hypothetical protein UMAG_02626 [Ustilago maydis 521]
MLPPHRRTPEKLIMPEELEATEQASTGQPCAATCRSPSLVPGKLSQPGVDAAAHFDLVIIGAGPAGLAVISRILESRPAALYTEDEHRHLHFTHRQRTPALIPSKVAKTSTTSKSSIYNKLQDKTRRSKPKTGKGLWNAGENDSMLCPCDGRIKILVIDKLGEGFMGLWRRNFNALGISHLRSPMFFHPDASDFDALIAYANRQGHADEGTPDQVIELIEKRVTCRGDKVVAPRGRGCRKRTRGKRSPSPTEQQNQALSKTLGSSDSPLPDLIEILGVVGKEKSKHKRKQQLQQHPKEHHSNAVSATSAKVHVNERDRRDYFTPSSVLFNSFTRDLEQRYRIQPYESSCSNTWPKVSQYFEGEIDKQLDFTLSSRTDSVTEAARLADSPVTTVKGFVKDLVWFDGAKQTVQDDVGNHSPGFMLELVDSVDGQNDSVVISAKAVVSAVSFGGVPMIPPYIDTSGTEKDTDRSANSSSILTPPSLSPPPACGPGWMHSSCLAFTPFPQPPSLAPSTPARERKMVVVGGGLTSAQIVVRALEAGFDKVIFITRGHLKSKHFDVDLGWVGRYSNYLKMQFWQNEDVQERLAMLRAARNGGSITPTYLKALARLQAMGKVEIRTHTTIADAAYGTCSELKKRCKRDVEEGEDDSCSQTEEGEDETAQPESTDGEDEPDSGEKQWALELRTSTDGGNVDRIFADYLFLATGAKIDFGGLPFLQHIQKTHPVRLVGGMPVLTADLEYRRDVPLFVTGTYAGLQIGPAAGNLGGMRDSADRIANRLLELLSLPEGVIPNVVSLPETVVPRPLSEAAPQHNETTTTDSSPAKPRKERVKADKSSPFTHFNFDLLSIEA